MLRHLSKNNFVMYVLAISKLKYETWVINNVHHAPSLFGEGGMLRITANWYPSNFLLRSNIQAIPVFKFVD